MRLCFISNPNSIHTRRWVDWFANYGHTVCLIADNPLKQRWEGIPIYDLPARFNTTALKYLIWSVWTRQIIRRWRPEIVHAHRVNGAGWLGAFSGFHPFVVTPWGTDLYVHPYQSRIFRRLAQHVLTHADLVTADSADLAKQALLFGSEPSKTQLIQWGVDTAIFYPGTSDPTVRARLHVNPGPVILSLRGIAPIYHIDTIIRAIPQVKLVFPQVTFIFLDYNTDLAYKAHLENLIADQALQTSVRWLSEITSREAVADLNRLADIAVSVPSSDGTPVSVLEAMACGAAPVVSDLPSLREWITDGENGLLVPVGDPEALAAAIVRLLQQPHLREQFRQRNQEIIHSRADHQAEMQKMEQLYESLCR